MPEARRHKRRIWLFVGGAALIAGAGLWAFRTPIADNLVEQQLDQRDIAARYTIESIGPVTQRLRNVSIGDPRNPDLTARWVEVDIGFGWSGPQITALRAGGVRLYGEVVDGRLSLGALDKFRDPESTDPFALPDMAVTLTDARARIETPWGDVGAKLDGHGNLRRDFDGQLAMVAPGISVGGCTARDTSFYGHVSIRKVEPRLMGPLRAASIRCADGAIRAASPQIALNLALSEDLRHWRGTFDASVSHLVDGEFKARDSGIMSRFSGTAKQTNISVKAQIHDLAGPSLSAGTLTITADARIGENPATVAGHIRIVDASASRELRKQIIDSVSATNGTPVGPIAAAASRAVARALADWGGEARFKLIGTENTRRLALIAPQFTASSGARLIGGNESHFALLLAAEKPTFIAQGYWQLAGGGLPSASVRLDRQADGTIEGEARFDPYTAGDARLALSPVQFSGGRSGLLHFATVATLSGPLGDGGVSGLSLPISGVLAPTGTLALAGGCTPVSLDSAIISGAQVDTTKFNICSQAGQPLMTWNDGGVRGLLTLPDPRIDGQIGGSPLLLSAARGQLDLATMHWSISAADIRLGEAGSATKFSIATVEGHPAEVGLTGTLAGGEGQIGAVPLHLSEIAGNWTWQNSIFGLDGGLVLSDAAADARFQPLISQDAHVQLADGVISATAAFKERVKGRPVVDVVIKHHLGDSSGFADLAVRDLRFDEGFQPDELSRLALGVVANVNGRVTGKGRIDWNANRVTSSGTFTTQGIDLAAAFGPVTGATTTIHFDDLLGLHSLPGQQISLATINPGFSISGGTVDYQLLGDNKVRIEGGSWPFAGGTLSLHPTTLDFNADQVRRLRFELTGVRAAVFLQQFGFDNISATGIFDGTIPVVIDGLGSRIEDGRLDARNGGTLAYVGTLTNHDLGVMANFAFNALKSLRYEDLTIRLNGDLDGEMVTDIRFGGVTQGKGAAKNFITRKFAQIPLIFNVKISAPFRQLITSAKGFYDPSLLIKQNLPALIEEQRKQNLPDNTPPVQPSESEPMP